MKKSKDTAYVRECPECGDSLNSMFDVAQHLRLVHGYSVKDAISRSRSVKIKKSKK